MFAPLRNIANKKLIGVASTSVAATTAYGYTSYRKMHTPTTKKKSSRQSLSKNLPAYSSIITTSTLAGRQPSVLFSPQEDADQQYQPPHTPLQQLPDGLESPDTETAHTPRSFTRHGTDYTLINDGYEHIELPPLTLPEFKPMSSDQVDNVSSAVQYVGEHLVDFVRNRIDDMIYLIRQDALKTTRDPTRLQQSYDQLHDGVYFNPYYEAIYRGWYETLNTNLKFGGTVPRHDYGPWINQIKRPKVYFDFFIGDEADLASGKAQVDRIVFQLYGDVVPKTTANFIGLTEGFMFGDRFVSYLHTKIHRIDKDLAFFGGDVITRDGTTKGVPFITDRILKDRFSDENFYLTHDRPGCLVMDNRGPHTNASHFFVTQRPLPELDKSYVVFGHVVDGFDVLEKINQVPVTSSGTPLKDIRIVKSGVYVEDPDRDDPFKSFKEQIPQMRDRKAEITPPPTLPSRLF